MCADVDIIHEDRGSHERGKDLKLWKTKESTDDRETEGNRRGQKGGRSNAHENVIMKPINLYLIQANE